MDTGSSKSLGNQEEEVKAPPSRQVHQQLLLCSLPPVWSIRAAVACAPC